MLPPLEQMLINENSSLLNALEILDVNAQGIVFAIDESRKAVGTLSDGDIRRALLKGGSLASPVKTFMCRQFVSLPLHSPPDVIQKHLSTRIRYIPLVDEENKIVDYACFYRYHRIPISEPVLGGNELAYVSDCINTGWISSQGKYVKRFEQNFGRIVGSPFCVAVSNGTVALHLALSALGIRAGDEVIVPDITFAATINSVLYMNAVPVIVDINPQTWTIDPEAIQKAITPKTRAIIPVHLYGQPCQMGEIMQIAKQYNLFIVEDCAEALGSEYHGKPVGTFGDIGTFSFFGNKTITTGEGGLITINDDEVYQSALELRDHGMSKSRRYWHTKIGFNYRITNLQAAIGCAQLERFSQIVERKIAIAAQYNRFFQNCGYFQPPASLPDIKNSFWLYTVLMKDNFRYTRDELIKLLLENGIETRPAFYPLHEMPPYTKYGAGDFSNSINFSRNALSFPSSINLHESIIFEICEKIRKILNM